MVTPIHGPPFPGPRFNLSGPHTLLALPSPQSNKPAIANSQSTPSLSGSASSSRFLQPPKLPIKRLTPAELQYKREHGFCFNCDAKYSPQHRCKFPSHLLLFDAETESHELMENPSIDLPLNEIDTPLVSYHALMGSSSPRTLRFKGLLNGHPVQVLVDGGSTHNFVQPRIVKFVALQLDSSIPFSVTVGNGAQLLCEGGISHVPLRVQGVEPTIDLFVLPIHGVDVVLGV